MPGKSNVRIKGVFVTCPRCGADAHIVDGRYDDDEEGLRILVGPEMPRREIEILINALQRVVREEVAPDAVPELLAEQHASPETVRRANNVQWTMNLAQLVLSVLSLLLAYQQQPITADQMGHIVRDAVEQVQEPAPSKEAQPKTAGPVLPPPEAPIPPPHQ